jgi:dethiobiotin synthetase
VNRVYLVGTDTGIGKTAIACALLAQARSRGIAALPFKPVQSGPPPRDAERLAAAAGLDADMIPRIGPCSFDPPLAPGLADDPQRFLDARHVDRTPLDRTADILAALEREILPALVLVEGAGGVHVPMPGGTWQPEWIARLAPTVAVIGRAGLGTINHCLLTIDALRALGCTPLGFYLCETLAPTSTDHLVDPRVVARARGVPHLGTLPHAQRPDAAPAVDLLSPLLAHLAE